MWICCADNDDYDDDNGNVDYNYDHGGDDNDDNDDVQMFLCVQIRSLKFMASPSQSWSTSFAGSRQIPVRWAHNGDDGGDGDDGDNDDDGDGDDDDHPVNDLCPNPIDIKTSSKFHIDP